MQEILCIILAYKVNFTTKIMQITVFTFATSSDTAPDAAFAGSMQLLAGVKLCTGRTITNHPHFENKLLRERTVQVCMVNAWHVHIIM